MPGPAPPESLPRRAPTYSGMETRRYLLLLGALNLLIAATGLGLVFAGTAYSRVNALGQITYHEEGFTRLELALTPARYTLLRGIILGAGLAGLTLAGTILLTTQPLARLSAELRHGAVRFSNWWRRLPRPLRRLMVGIVTMLTVIRVWYLVRYPLGTDEISSYNYFISGGPLVITSFYPIPNNHIGYNLLAWPLLKLSLAPRLVMRLPTLVLGTVGTVTGYVLLARLTGVPRATLVIGLVSFSPLWVYYAAAGRGYFLQICLLQIGFFAVVEQLRPAPTYRHLAWLAFIGSSGLGLYLIPTYAYPLASLLLGLGAGFGLQRRWQQLGELVLAAGIIGLTAFVLYAPVGLISGWDRLFANRYVVSVAKGAFWPAYRAVLYERAAELFGPSLRLSGPAWLAGALLGGGVAHRFFLPGTRRTVALLAWSLLALPLLLMAAQRVYAPTRVLLYVSFYGYLLGGLLLLRRTGLRNRIGWRLITVIGLGIGGWRLYHDQDRVRASRYETLQLEQAFTWLQAHPTGTTAPARVWINAPLHELFFAYYNHLAASGSPLKLYSGPTERLAEPYDFIVLGRGRRATAPGPVLRGPYRRAYQDELVTIYRWDPQAHRLPSPPARP